MNERVQLSFSPDNKIATIQLGADDEKAPTWTPTRMASFTEALSTVSKSGAGSLVIKAPSIDTFCVGADISLIASVTDPAIGEKLAREGQSAFDQLEDLGIVTIAAIGGPCVGGGCEMALACTYRIITNAPSSVIGLPETKLGILPGFGGTYRLPRLIGLPKALDVILNGKTLRSQQALKAGLVDEVTSPEKLLERAYEIAEKRNVPRRAAVRFVEKILTYTSVGRSIVTHQAKKKVLETSKGFYPAPLAALDVTSSGLGKTRHPALEREAAELGKLIVTPQSKSLVHIYFLTEAAKSIGKSERSNVKELHTLVVGAGIMGAGIASTCARSGHQVIVKDTSEEALSRGKSHVNQEISKVRHLSTFERGATTSRIDWITHSSPTESRTGLVIEAVFEDISLKKKILSNLAEKVSEQCILASNTSSLSITEIARGIPHPERVIGMHFFNPVEKMPLVEIIKGEATSQETINKVAAFASRLGKYPIIVGDVPGFLVNRILVPYLNEALYLLADGHRIEEIDNAALAFGMPMGPIRLLDEVGLDVAAHVSKIMTDGYGERMAPPQFSASLLAMGRKGRKSGGGFYEHSGKTSTPWSGVYDALSIPTSPKQSLSATEMQSRLILHLVNEAMKCLQEGVAGEDKEFAEKQIDLGTVMGIGFPPFRGGVLHYARSRGLETIQSELVQFQEKWGIRYSPFQ
jgi:3-hydroxyacyl-CoA dehydrogenase/enoyl-CoA hydratase/3-hydroxybutyryl-CoA epimerase